MAQFPPLTEEELVNFKEWLITAPDYRQTGEFAIQGWEEEQVVWKSEKEMLCSICKTFPRKAFILPCGHYFCQSCLTEWFFTSDGERSFNNAGLIVQPCPYCRQGFSRTGIQVKSQDDFNDTVLLKCINTDCPVQLPPVAMRIHELLYCEKRIIYCPSIYCEHHIKLDDALQHFTNCPARLVFCDKCELCYFITRTDHDCIKALKKKLAYFKRKCGVENHLRFTHPPLDMPLIIVSDKNYLGEIHRRSMEIENGHAGRFSLHSLRGSLIEYNYTSTLKSKYTQRMDICRITSTTPSLLRLRLRLHHRNGLRL